MPSQRHSAHFTGPYPTSLELRSIGLELSILPPLGCKQRLSMITQEQEDTNKTPILPRPRGSFAFPAYTVSKGYGMVPYAGFGYVPHVPNWRRKKRYAQR